MTARDKDVDEVTFVEPSAGSSRLLDTELAAEIEFLAARARAVGTAHANRFLQEVGLKVRSYSVLALACTSASPSQRELAEFLSLDASQIVALIDDLEGRQFVTRSADPRDRRSNCITATDAGQALYRRARKLAQDAEDESLSRLTDTEKNTLRTLLKRIAFPVG